NFRSGRERIPSWRVLDRADLHHPGRKGQHMSLLLGALTLGFIFSFIALGVYISFRVFNFPDITADGSSTLGAALVAMLLVHNVNPLLATVAAFAGGFLAGTLTGTLATK